MYDVINQIKHTSYDASTSMVASLPLSCFYDKVNRQNENMPSDLPPQNNGIYGTLLNFSSKILSSHYIIVTSPIFAQ